MGFVAAGRVRLFLVASIAAAQLPGHAAADVTSASREGIDRFTSVAVPFVAYRGQKDSGVAFVARTFAGPVFVTTDGKIAYGLAPSPDGTASTVVEAFADSAVQPVGIEPSPTVVSTFVGAGNGGALPAFNRVRLGEVAPGITAELRATGRNVEKLFTLAAGVDASRLVVHVDGAARLMIGAEQSLVAETRAGPIAFTAPIAWQEDAHGRKAVDVRYTLPSPNAYAFALGPHDPGRPVFIDPLVKSTYSGGAGNDVIRAILVHPGSGDIYVAGSSTSPNFQLAGGGTVSGSPFAYKPSGKDAFIARYSSSLTSLKSLTYYGGSADDVANAIAIMPSSGHVYVAGTTSSSDLTNASGIYAGATSNAFVAHFDGGLATLIGARYFGGTAADNGMAIAADDLAGEIVLAGDTTSANLPLGSGGGPQSVNNGGQDAFVARFAADLTLIRTTYFGGSQNDYARAVAIDLVSGDVIIAGGTQSSSLPKVTGGAQSQFGGVTDGFLARYNRTLTTLQQSTYFGGTGSEDIAGVAVHPFTSHLYVTGGTTSSSLPGKVTGQSIKAAGTDAFVARIYPELTGVKAVTFFGDAGEDFGTAVAISPFTGEVYIGGYTNSTALPGSVLGAQESNGGASSNDAFIVRMDAGLTTAGAWQATFRGGSGDDFGRSMALSDQQVYLAGETSSANFPAVGGSAQNAPGGGTTDGYIAMVPTDLRATTSNPAAFSFAPGAGALPLSFQTSAPVRILPTASAVVYIDGQAGSTWCASSAANCSCDLTAGAFTSASLTISGATPYYVCVREIAPPAPNAIGEATLHIGATAATFRVTTGQVPGFGCSLDVDGNGAMDALTDGLIVIRALFGLTGATVTNGAVGTNALRPTWPDIQQYLNANCGGSFAP